MKVSLSRPHTVFSVSPSQIGFLEGKGNRQVPDQMWKDNRLENIILNTRRLKFGPTLSWVVLRVRKKFIRESMDSNSRIQQFNSGIHEYDIRVQRETVELNLIIWSSRWSIALDLTERERERVREGGKRGERGNVRSIPSRKRLDDHRV